MDRLKSLTFLKRMLLLFWAIFFTLVLGSNLADGIKELGWLTDSFAFASGNFQLMERVTVIYSTPTWVVAILFLGVLIWEGLAAWLFWQSFRRFSTDRSVGQAAFSVAILLVAAFVVMDELFLAFRVVDLEKAHLLLLIALVVTLFLYRAKGEDPR